MSAVYFQPESTRGMRAVPGPADLQGKTSGTVFLSGDWSDADITRWGVSLGLFAARGGRISWLR